MPSVNLTGPESLEHVDKLRSWLRPRLQAGERFTLSIEAERRNVSQNSKLHALLGEIAAQKEWAGQRWDAHDWKRLLTAAWMRANGKQASVIPAIDGYGFDVLYAHTSRLSKAEMSDLLEFVVAWCATNGIRNAIEEQ